MEEHPDHLGQSDGAEGHDEEEADHVEFSRGPGDRDLGLHPGADGVRGGVGQVVADLVLPTAVAKPGEESPGWWLRQGH